MRVVWHERALGVLMAGRGKTNGRARQVSGQRQPHLALITPPPTSQERASGERVSHSFWAVNPSIHLRFTNDPGIWLNGPFPAGDLGISRDDLGISMSWPSPGPGRLAHGYLGPRDGTT